MSLDLAARTSYASEEKIGANSSRAANRPRPLAVVVGQLVALFGEPA